MKPYKPFTPDQRQKLFDFNYREVCENDAVRRKAIWTEKDKYIKSIYEKSL